MRVAELLLDIKRTISSLEDEIAATTNRKKLEKLNLELDSLRKGPRRYDKPMINEHVEYLYEMLTHTSQKIGKDAFERYEVLFNMWEEIN